MEMKESIKAECMFLTGRLDHDATDFKKLTHGFGKEREA